MRLSVCVERACAWKIYAHTHTHTAKARVSYYTGVVSALLGLMFGVCVAEKRVETSGVCVLVCLFGALTLNPNSMVRVVWPDCAVFSIIIVIDARA